MSTFDGIVDEFPDIRIDFFRTHAGRTPPSACFLSHIHSDHLLGLESLKMPFVYCSAATKRILLRMEKYPHRINFQKGILEARKQTYKHLKKILRELPLQTPVELELRPRTTIRVTLFDANHCPGAVMFLIEGDGKAILYTGDIRAENWWVNSIVRSPLLLPYSCGHKILDCIYLDTTFASHDDIYKDFPPKAEGLGQLITKVNQCPKNSIFYFRAWTLGYEDVWITLSNMLDSQVHVAEYQMRLFASLAEDACGIDQGAALVGCAVGNQMQPGCLTTESNTSIHSCEPGMECHAELCSKPNVVWITPIISTLSDGTEVAEIGAGGGRGDLYQVPELEIAEDAAIQALRQFCTSIIEDKDTLKRFEEVFEKSKGNDTFKISLDGLGLDPDQEVSLNEFVNLISSMDQTTGSKASHPTQRKGRSPQGQQVIHFPYSRHSSYSELLHLVSVFRPRDICPCTVDIQLWSEELTMRSLFGDLCSANAFRYDEQIRSLAGERRGREGDGNHQKRKSSNHDSQETASQGSDSEEVYRSARMDLPVTEEVSKNFVDATAQSPRSKSAEVIMLDDSSAPSDDDVLDDNLDSKSDLSVPAGVFDSQEHEMKVGQLDGVVENENMTTKDRSTSRQETRTARRNAYKRAKLCLTDHSVEHWNDLHLRSIGWKGHSEEETLL